MYRLNGPPRRLGQGWPTDVEWGGGDWPVSIARGGDWPGAGAESVATSALTIPSEPFVAAPQAPTEDTTPWWTGTGEILRGAAEIARAVAPIWYPEPEAPTAPLAPYYSRTPILAPGAPGAGTPRWVWPVVILGAAGALAWVMFAQPRRRRTS